MLALIILLGGEQPALAKSAVGITNLSATVGSSGREVVITLWYPAKQGGSPVLVGDNAVFKGVEAFSHATVSEGKFPLVLVSHGGLRSASNLSGWIATDLAVGGFLVAVVTGPRLAPDAAHQAVSEIWERPADISAALTTLLRHPEWSSRIDRDRVAALGFFLGGSAVLSLAGGQYDVEKFKQSCAEKGTGVDCAWFAAAGIDLKNADPAALGSSRTDTRIKSAIAIDPEYSTSLTFASVSHIAIPITIYNLGKPEAVLPGFNASALGSKIPHSQYEILSYASRFSAFSLCKHKGAAILVEEGGDATICHEGTEKSRGPIHKKLAGQIIEVLKAQLKLK
jgi:predicted dienelactone hydrolase